MLEAKEGERTCTECGDKFTPPFPPLGNERDEICETCDALSQAPAWYFDGREETA